MADGVKQEERNKMRGAQTPRTRLAWLVFFFLIFFLICIGLQRRNCCISFVRRLEFWGRFCISINFIHCWVRVTIAVTDCSSVMGTKRKACEMTRFCVCACVRARLRAWLACLRALHLKQLNDYHGICFQLSDIRGHPEQTTRLHIPEYSKILSHSCVYYHFEYNG